MLYHQIIFIPDFIRAGFPWNIYLGEAQHMFEPLLFVTPIAMGLLGAHYLLRRARRAIQNRG